MTRRGSDSKPLLVTLLCGILWFTGFASARGQSIPWEFHPPRAGLALYEGGWAYELPLGRLGASPEFSFPLQLVHLNTRATSGLFGRSWFCPQLESSVVPRDRGLAVWTTPAGGFVSLQADPKSPGDYRSGSGEWRGRVNASRFTLENGEGWRLVYQRGKLETVISPTGRNLEFVREGAKLLGVQLRDPATGLVQPLVRLFYADGGRRVALIDVNDRRTRFGYEKDGAADRLIFCHAEQGWPTRFRYDAKTGGLDGVRLERSKEPEVVEFRTEYVPANNPVEDTPQRRRDPAVHRLIADRDFAYAYPQEGRIVRTPKNGGPALEGRFDLRRGVMEAGAAADRERLIYYRAPGKRYDNRLRRVERDGRVVREYRYDRKHGRLKEVIDENGEITFFDYDPKRPAGPWEPKPIRLRQGTRKANRVIAEYAYDAAGRVLRARDARGHVTRYTYSPRGELVGMSDASGGQTKLTYDGLGRILVVDRNGQVEKFAYDNRGRVAARAAADGTKTEFAYDAMGQIAEVRQNGKAQTSVRRDAMGRVIEEADGLGRKKRFDYDDRGNLLAEHLPNGSTTRYEYDTLNRRTAQIDGNGNRIEFAYDPAGRLIRQTNALDKILTWTYDAAGQLVERTNGVQTIRYRHETSRRLTSITYESSATAASQSTPDSAVRVDAAQTVTYRYDARGQITEAVTPNARFDYVRDANGQVEAVRCVADARDQLLRYRFDSAGRRTGLLLAELEPAIAPAGGRAGRDARYEVLQQTEYTYDPAGRLAAITTNGQPIVTYRYDGAGRLVGKSFGNGINAEIGYDPAGRLGRTVFSGGPFAEPKILEYTWDAAS